MINYVWQEEEYTKWIDKVREGSKPSYQKALELYLLFRSIKDRISLTPKTLIDEIEEDRRKTMRKQGTIEGKIIAFYNWLKYEYASRGRYGKEPRTGVSDSRAKAYVMAIRGFYRSNRFPILADDLSTDLKREATKKPINRKHRFSMEEIKAMIEHPQNTPLDKAIIIFQAQSMMDTSTLTQNVLFKTVLSGFKEKYGFTSKGFLLPLIDALRNTQHPLMLSIARVKTGENYVTFVGRDSCLCLADYLEFFEGKEHPSVNDLLFILHGESLMHGEGVYKRDYVSKLWRNRVLQLGIIDEARLKSADINPARPHSIRASTSDILKIQGGINNDLVEFWMGHKVGETKLAYALTLQAEKGDSASVDDFERMRDIYKKHESLISIR